MDLTGNRAVITGAAGFIGSHLTDLLVNQGVSVVAVDDFSHGTAQNLQKAVSTGACEIVEASVEDLPAIAEVIQDADIVFHTAALNLVSSIADPARDLMVNGLGTLNVLEAAASSKSVKVVVHSSTGSVYGEPIYVPQDEGHPLNPVSPYGISKLAGEKYVSAWPSFKGVNTISLRYFNVYGSRQRFDTGGGVIPIFITRALAGQHLVIEGTGLQDRSFTHVGDVVRATVLAAMTEDAWGNVYNVASNEVTSIKELAILINDLVGSDVEMVSAPRRPGDVDSFRPDIRRAAEKLGFTPKTTLRDGLKLTIDWIQEMGIASAGRA